MSKVKTILQVYQAAIAFLDLYYFRYYSDDLGSLLGGMRLFKEEKNWRDSPITWDQFFWDNWIHLVEQGINKKDIDLKNITVHEGFELLRIFLKNYLNEINSVELQAFYEKIVNVHQKEQLWNDWVICYDKAVNNELKDCSDSLVCRHTELDISFGLDIIIQFLNDFTQLKEVKTLQEQLVEIKNKQKLNSLKAYFFKFQEEYVYDKQLTFLELFKIFYELLKFYIDENNFKDLVSFLKKVKPFDDGQAEDYEIYYQWQKAVYQVFYQFK